MEVHAEIAFRPSETIYGFNVTDYLQNSHFMVDIDKQQKK